jgi:hypothetical protein
MRFANTRILAKPSLFCFAKRRPKQTPNPAFAGFDASCAEKENLTPGEKSFFA